MRTRIPQILLTAGAALAVATSTASADPLPLPTIAFTESAVDVTEGAPRELTLTRVVPRGGAQLGPAIVELQPTPQGTPGATSGTDYKIPAAVEFADGELQKKVPVEALTDTVTEPPEAFNLRAVANRGDVERDATSTAVITIKDPPPKVTQQQGGTGNGTGQGPAADTMAPTIGNVVLAPSRFRAGRTGTTILYSLTESAEVTVRVERLNKKRRFVPAGTVPGTDAAAGVNRLTFKGRVGRRKLRPGAYRLTVTAVDAAGNSATSAPRRFRLLR